MLLETGTAAFVVRPSDPRRGLVLLPDVFGLRELFRGLARRLAAEWGMTVCCPEPLPGVRHASGLEERLEARASRPDEEVLRDIRLAAAATGSAGVGVLGFCMGGTNAYLSARLLAAEDASIDGVVACYGPVRIAGRADGRADAPLGALAGRNGRRVLAVVGSEDPLVSAADLTLLEEDEVSVVRVSGAGHAFIHDPLHPNHRPADAKVAWSLAARWLGAEQPPDHVPAGG